MRTSRTPGVYVEEVSLGSKPIEGVGAAVAFVGVAPGGPTGRPLRISSWTHFERVYRPTAARERPVRAGGVSGPRGSRVLRERRPRLLDGTRGPTTIRGSEATASLAGVDEITVVSVPDRTPRSRDLEGHVIGHCEAAGNRMAILDPPPDLDLGTSWTGGRASGAATRRPRLSTGRGSRLPIRSPTGRSSCRPPATLPAWARTDNAHGVHRAPTDETCSVPPARCTRFARTSRKSSADEEHQQHSLLPAARHSRLGSRTLSSDPEWQYVNIRQPPLWSRSMPGRSGSCSGRTTSSFGRSCGIRSPSFSPPLDGRRPHGRLSGKRSSSSATKRRTRPKWSRSGQVVVEVGFAPLRPAEFVVLRISRLTAGASKADP